MDRNYYKYALKDAISALSNEMKITSGGWHFMNISKIKDCSLQFKYSETKTFIVEIMQYLRKPETTAPMKFKIAQLLNLLKSYHIAGFNDIIQGFRPQIYSAFMHMGDTPLYEPSQNIINNLFKMPASVTPIATKATSKFNRVKTFTPSANVIRHIAIHNPSPVDTFIKHSTPPPIPAD